MVDSSVALTLPSRSTDQATAQEAKLRLVHLPISPPPAASPILSLQSTFPPGNPDSQPSQDWSGFLQQGPLLQPHSQHLLSWCYKGMSSARTQLSHQVVEGKPATSSTQMLTFSCDLVEHSQSFTRHSLRPLPQPCLSAPCISSSNITGRENAGKTDFRHMYACTCIHVHAHMCTHNTTHLTPRYMHMYAVFKIRNF